MEAREFRREERLALLPRSGLGLTIPTSEVIPRNRGKAIYTSSRELTIPVGCTGKLCTHEILVICSVRRWGARTTGLWTMVGRSLTWEYLRSAFEASSAILPPKRWPKSGMTPSRARGGNEENIRTGRRPRYAILIIYTCRGVIFFPFLQPPDLILSNFPGS